MLCFFRIIDEFDDFGVGEIGENFIVFADVEVVPHEGAVMSFHGFFERADDHIEVSDAFNGGAFLFCAIIRLVSCRVDVVNMCVEDGLYAFPELDVIFNSFIFAFHFGKSFLNPDPS